jgi:hypothetical protein
MKHASADHPFPGLRAFELEDREFFFGRDEHVNSLCEKLLLNRFIAVVGSSGSGKSSLVRAGLLGRLAALSTSEVGPRWKTIVMRPLGHPLQQLASALATASTPSTPTELPDHGQRRTSTALADRAAARLSRSSLGLVELMRELTVDATARLLIIVDQFEELFRYAAAQSDRDFDERALFVKHLLRAADDPTLRSHVLITMRSEFIGDCAQFSGLPEAISDSQFLTPRLTRNQRRDAVVGPLKLAGGEIAPALLQRILNDIGHETDQLPVMQHALMRTWQIVLPTRSLTLQAYESIGTMESAISRHAEDLLQNRTESEGPPPLRTEVEKHNLEKIFRALTEVDKDGRAIRRPTRFIELAPLCSSPEAAAALIDVFRDEDCAFLSANKAAPIDDDTIVDITHEALIRKWKTLALWVERETEDGKNIQRLHDVAARRKSDPDFVLGPREAAERARWWQESKPTPAWARRYLKADGVVTFEDICDLLEASAKRAARDAGLERQLREVQLEHERLMREKAERDVRQKETELELEQMAHKLAEAQRRRLAAQAPVQPGSAEQSIFVSFADQNRGVAIEVHDWLVKQGVQRIFLDLRPDPLSDSKRLSEAIRTSGAVMLLLSQAWGESRHCLRELEIASEARVHLIAVRLEPFNMSSNIATLALKDVRIVADWTQKSERERLKARLVQLGLLQEYFSYIPGRSPYPGLVGFDEADSAVFFGRSAEIADALARLRVYRREGGCHILAVLGASGSGKSSFLRAGLWPRLKRDRASFFCLPILRPREWHSPSGGLDIGYALQLGIESDSVLHGALADRTRILVDEDTDGEFLEQELSSISEQLTRQMTFDPDASRVTIVLAVDQAEELFRADREYAFNLLARRLTALVERNRVPLIIIFSIRSDRFEMLRADPLLGGLRMDIFSLPPIRVSSLREVIEGPARVAGLSIDPRLVEDLLTDLEPDHVADALPLLAFTLARLYEESGTRGELTFQDYESLGGFSGAIELAIERALEHARNDSRVPRNRDEVSRLLRRAFIPALVAIDPDTGSPRRRLANLADISSEVRPILDHLVQERLLVASVGNDGRQTLEVAHEAILRQWGLLRGWLEEDAALLGALDGLKRAARDWEDNAQRCLAQPLGGAP